MTGDISHFYKGPKGSRISTWMLRGGPGQDWPCNNPNMVECAASECQEIGRCRLSLIKQGETND